MPVNQNRAAMSQYRMETAQECLRGSYTLLREDALRSSANRSYYAIFHAIRAVLALDGLDFKKHSAVMAKFRELYIKTGIFDIKFSDTIRLAFDVRQDSDYEDFYVISREDARQQIENAAEFIEAVCRYLNSNRQ